MNKTELLYTSEPYMWCLEHRAYYTSDLIGKDVKTRTHMVAAMLCPVLPPRDHTP